MKVLIRQLITATRSVEITIPDVPTQTDAQKQKLGLAYVKAALAAGQPVAWKIGEFSIKAAEEPVVDDILF